MLLLEDAGIVGGGMCREEDIHLQKAGGSHRRPFQPLRYRQYASDNMGRVPCIRATNVHGSSDCVRGRSSPRDTPLRALQRRRARE